MSWHSTLRGNVFVRLGVYYASWIVAVVILYRAFPSFRSTWTQSAPAISVLPQASSVLKTWTFRGLRWVPVLCYR